MPVRIERDEPENITTTNNLSNNNSNSQADRNPLINSSTKQFILMTIFSMVIRLIMRTIFRQRRF
ncbi:MAG: hypothetical protein LC115_04150 [Bacteroidia bacterium]|nr:hypothetical protein [Bacteroidia bacterium]